MTHSIPVSMRIRTALKKDAEALAINNVLLAEETEHKTLQKDTVLAGVTALLADPSKGFYLVAEDEGVIIGQTMITVEWSDWRNKPIWWVQSVYVSKEWRHTGVFTRLLYEVQQRAVKKNVAFLRLYVHTSNLSAIEVYKKTGWHAEPYLLYSQSLNHETRCVHK
jgi:GNAT superfamily N-acetyltransferase